MLADVWVVRSCDLGLTTDTIHCRSHLGHLLKPMDTVLGYAIADSNVNDSNFDKLPKTSLPDVILIKKNYPDRARHRKRTWKLKRMTTDTEINFESDNKLVSNFNNYNYKLNNSNNYYLVTWMNLWMIWKKTKI